MKIAIVSDSHDNLTTLKKVVNWLNQEKIKTMIHCGDVCSPLMLRETGKAYKGVVHLVFGNVDGDHFSMLNLERIEKIPNIRFYGKTGEIEIKDKKIAFTHELLPAKGLAVSDKYDFVFYGHSHQPWEERMGNCRLVNPGTVGGMFNKASFAVYDTKTNKLELKLVEKL